MGRARDLIPPPRLTVPPDEPPFEFERAKSRRRQWRGKFSDVMARHRYPAVTYSRRIYIGPGEPFRPGPLREGPPVLWEAVLVS